MANAVMQLQQQIAALVTEVQKMKDERQEVTVTRPWAVPRWRRLPGPTGSPTTHNNRHPHRLPTSSATPSLVPQNWHLSKETRERYLRP